MAKPRVFISSTYYDLKHIRSSLELFVESLGFEPVLSEKGDIPYTPDIALDESCYREAAAADIFVLVVGGRYGSEVSSADPKVQGAEIEAYDSITRREFETAHDNNIPIFVLIESSVHAEYRTYLKNKDSKDIKYAHVDSVNVFRFIEFISLKQRNNPIFNFEKSAQIETWLREQWSGLFRELLKNRSQQKQLLALTSQVGELKEVNETLKTYLEVVLNKVTPETSDHVIEVQEKRLEDIRKHEIFRANSWVNYIKNLLSLDDPAAEEVVLEPNNDREAIMAIRKATPTSRKSELGRVLQALTNSDMAQADFNNARYIFGREPITFKTGIDLADLEVDDFVSPSAPKRKGRSPPKQ